MDGTLVDSEPLWLICEKELMAQFNYSWSPADQAHCLGGPLTRVGEYMHTLAGGVESAPFFTNSLIALMVEKLHAGADLMEGASELMDLCMKLGIPMALVSASPRIIVDAVLQNLTTHYFAVSISSDDVMRTKPDPEGYLKAAQFFDLPTDQCLVLEDSQVGVLAAEASGACVIAVPHLQSIAQSQRVKTVTSLKELDFYKLRDLYATWHN